MKNRKVIIATTAVLTVTIALVVRALFFGGTESTVTGPERKPVQVQAVTASVETISDILELTGSVVPQQIARLASPAEGPVTNLRVREGDQVKKGDILLSIGRREGIDAQITSYREAVKKEEENLKRTRQLVDSKALPGEELDRARAAYENARAQLVKAMEAVQDYSVVAPWDGIVSKVIVRDGDYVIPRTPLVEIYDPVNLVIQSAVPERYAAQIHKDHPLEIHLDAFPDSVFHASIVRIYPFLEERMRTRTIEAEIAARVSILPGMFARLELPLKTVDSAIVVPSQSIIVLPSGERVVFVVKENAVSRMAVELGIEQGNRIQVLSGVAAGDLIVVAGNEKLKPGAKVRMIQASPKPTGSGGDKQ